MVTGIYSLYYSDPEVLAVVARTTGYTPRSPQPDGYTLPAFDPGILEKVAARAPHFRKTGGSDRDHVKPIAMTERWSSSPAGPVA